jgi:hypothetical protein
MSLNNIRIYSIYKKKSLLLINNALIKIKKYNDFFLSLIKYNSLITFLIYYYIYLLSFLTLFSISLIT